MSARRTIHENGREDWHSWARMPEQTMDGWILSASGPWLRPPQQIKQGQYKGEGAKKPGAEEGQAKGEGAEWQAKGEGATSAKKQQSKRPQNVAGKFQAGSTTVQYQ